MTRARKIAAIVVAAGRGERAQDGQGDVPKQYRRLAGIPMVARSVSALLDSEAIDHVVVVISASHRAQFSELGLSNPRLLAPVEGGATRQASVLAGLMALSALNPDLVLIHDAARPFVSPAIIDGVLATLADHDAAVPAIPVTDTLKRAPDGKTVLATEDRAVLYAAQTPQGFRYPQILSAHMRASTLPRDFTDDTAIAEWAGLSVALSAGSAANIKITLPEDFARAECMLTGFKPMETRVGSGYDVHAFEPGDHVWLGGVKIPHNQKLKGHSDADSALHALTDAIYGALGEGDIGTHFPPSDPQWRGAASIVFLQHAVQLVAARKGRIINLDVTIICESPRINPHVLEMRQTISGACGIALSRVAVKATTNERLGFLGREEGIVATATATLELVRED